MRRAQHNKLDGWAFSPGLRHANLYGVHKLEQATPDAAAEPRLLRVFLASPSDVTEEREALSRLARDINDVALSRNSMENAF